MRVMRSAAALCLLVVALAGATAAEAPPTVRVREGALCGRISAMKGSSKRMAGFLGVPYAKPPVGDLRFKDPEPAEPWDGERKATKECSDCAQPLNPAGGVGTFVKGNENCLCLNVFSPYPLPKNASVMVWIHGGAFVSGSGGELIYGPDFFVAEGVILVTLNYRLGALGFLNLGHEEAPGNQGLKDQSLALKWVHDNIEAFGGNPNNVTIFGESAGSASVHFQTLSPMSKGLFGAAIMQSGSALDPWAWKRSGRGNAARLLAAVGCDAALLDDPPAAAACLRRVPASALGGSTVAYLSQEDKDNWLDISFSPTLDGKFLTDEPCRLVAEGRAASVIPVMAGFNSDEGIIGIPMMRMNGGVEPTATALANGKGVCSPCEPRPSPETLKKRASAVNKRYFNGEGFSEKHMQGFANYSTYYMFFRGIITSALSRARNSNLPQYFYEFDVEGDLNFAKVLFSGKGLAGASHADELAYLFYNKLVGGDVTENSVEDLTRRRLVNLWTNFAKNRQPTPITNNLIPIIWEHFNATKESYLYIGNGGVEIKHFPLKEERDFFDSLRNLS